MVPPQFLMTGPGHVDPFQISRYYFNTMSFIVFVKFPAAMR